MQEGRYSDLTYFPPITASETDPQRIADIRMAIAEGKTILKNRKLSAEKREVVEQSVRRSLTKIGIEVR